MAKKAASKTTKKKSIVTQTGHHLPVSKIVTYKFSIVKRPVYNTPNIVGNPAAKVLRYDDIPRFEFSMHAGKKLETFYLEGQYAVDANSVMEQ